MSDTANSTAPPARGKPVRTGRVRAEAPRDPLKSFWRWIAAPAALVYLAICVLVLATLGLMTSEINRIDGDRGARSIAASLDSFVVQLSDQVIDEAVWTEAYLNTYARFNPAWLDSTWGATARADGHYDTVVVTDVAGSILFGESLRGPLSGALDDHYGSSSDMIAELARRIAEEGDDASIGNYARTSAGPAAIAAAVIRGQSSQLAIPSADWRILWLARRIDDALLKSIAQRFHVPVPRIVHDPASRASGQTLTLRDAGGSDVGTIVWQPLRPGDAAFVHTASVAAILLLIIAALVFAVLSAFRRSILRRAELDERDWISARYDRSTRLLNRFGLEEVLGRSFSNRVPRLNIGLACVEFEGLKDISASYGQETAEQLLDRLADLIDLALDGHALIARIGPDQFALACTDPDAGAAIGRYAAIVIELVAEAIAVGDLRLKLRASVGIATRLAAHDEVGPVLDNAATALQRGRETGDPVTVYEPSLEESRERRLAMQSDIRRGLDADEFDLQYQPIFDFSAQAMLGVEALLRWPRRVGGVLSPNEFIPVAETSGLIEELGLFALRRACEDIVDIPDIKISVNISTVQLRSPTLASRVESILRSTDFPPERLQLEVTESFLLAQPERAKATIEELRARGITLALDDFGTGFSSVGYLQQFSFDRVKLDRSLVDRIDDDPVKLALVESTMIFAFAMGLSVTAEGVERKEEAATLMRLGCREFQGYLLSKPLGRDDLVRLTGESWQLRQAG